MPPTTYETNVSITPRLKSSENFFRLSYEELEERNMEVKKEKNAGKPQSYFQNKFTEILKKEKGIKAVTVCFSDMEGRFHMLDYNKTFLLDSSDNLTFDGSSIRGFTAQNNSDLRLMLDWSSFRYLPADVFGDGKVLLFANVQDKDGKLYMGDYRANLMTLANELWEKHKIRVNVAPEVEGHLLEGVNAEHNFDEKSGFEVASKGGYFNVLPQDRLRQFIDRLAEATRAMAFENEKDHPEVAPGEFELNYRYTDILLAADQVQIYKVIARQIAKNFGLTASFLAKPIMKINGNGMHTNISLNKNGKNIFYDKKGELNLSQDAHNFMTSILYYASDICLGLNSSVNAYRRLDPHFEAPNEIKRSAVDRGSMIRIPIGNEKSARIEVRTVAPDANPYLAFYLILKAGLKGMFAKPKELKEMYKLYSQAVKKVPGNIYQALKAFNGSDFIKEVMYEDNRKKYAALKQAAADRCPRELGTRVKSGEIWYHHEVTNQMLWSEF
ncbi:glutamine synthetase family protein [Patescibacteria group bacterium]|nr:glutamine synthetase family protein [Patescibacteria group bacterium]MBU1683506.1 glutamine synthetase family protein [Patescibacteria group bacterium]MBU1934851.1 glutamine synthetase family protein [Patescibacteria group bacterium]